MLRTLVKQGGVLNRRYVTNVLLGTLKKGGGAGKSFVIEFLRNAKKALAFLAGIEFECCHSGKRKRKNSLPALRSLKVSRSAVCAWETGLL